MPRPSARPSRLTHARARLRLRSAIGLACAALLLAACGGGGGGGGGGGAPVGSTASAANQSSSVTIAWNGASGPVAGYSVFVQRGTSDYKHEADVAQAKVRLSGAPGSTARVIVVAFDATSQVGPSSPSSAQFTFPAPSAASSASAASAGTAGIAVASLAAGTSSGLAASSATATAPVATGKAPTPVLSGGAIVWQSGDAFRLTDAALVTTRLFARPAPGAELVAVADFDADGKGDLLWLGADGGLAYMPGHGLRGSDPVSLVDLGALAAGERVIGAGDFDGDGYGDVLVAKADAVYARLTTPGGAPAIADLGAAGQAVLAGVADFDANGSDDIAWVSSTGALVVWLIDGGKPTASVELALAAGLDVLGIGDFDGDGAAEIAVRGPDGNVYLIHPLAAVPALEPVDLAGAWAWHGVGAVDLDRDGSDELVLAMAGAIRIAGLPGDQILTLEPESPWQPVQLLR